MNVIDLSSVEEECTGLIVPLKTSVYISNQTGGISCSHPCLEGIFIPLSRFSFTDLWNCIYPDPLRDWWIYGCHTYEDSYLKIVPQFLQVFGLEKTFEILTPKEFKSILNRCKQESWVKKDDFKESVCWGKAWVPLKLKSTGPEHLNSFKGQPLILTYLNSD